MRLKHSLAAALAASALLLAGGRAWSDDTPAKGTGVLTGHVNDPAGKPAPKVLVSLTLKSMKKTADAPTTQPKKKGTPGPTATTDDNGDFKIDNLAAGQYLVTANVKNLGRQQLTVNITEGQTTDVKMQLVKAKKKPATPAT